VTERPSTHPKQFTLATLLVAFLLVGIGCSVGRWFGLQGLAFFLDVLVLSVGVANFARLRHRTRIWIPKLSLVEFIVCCLICIILHGLLLPPVYM